MRDAECSEANEISNIRSFRFLLFELWLFVYTKYGQFSMYFHDITGKKLYFFSPFFIRFRTFLKYLDKKIKTALIEGRVGVCRSLTH